MKSAPGHPRFLTRILRPTRATACHRAAEAPTIRPGPRECVQEDIPQLVQQGAIVT
jgi:hypothetical protein